MTASVEPLTGRENSPLCARSAAVTAIGCGIRTCRRRASVRGLDGLTRVSVLLDRHVGTACVAEIEERLRISSARGLAEVARDKAAHDLGK